jgi:hypothetical protein
MYRFQIELCIAVIRCSIAIKLQNDNLLVAEQQYELLATATITKSV